MVCRRGVHPHPLFVCALLLLALVKYAWAQGLPQSPYGAPSAVRGGLGSSQPDPLAMPGTTGEEARESSSIYFNEQMLRGLVGPIPNLQVGYLYCAGSRYGSSSRLIFDYLMPVTFGRGDSSVFGEAHGEITNFWNAISSLWQSADTTPTIITTTTGTSSGLKSRTDLSFGGGYRTILNENTLLGVNGFFDSAELGGKWYPSGGVGFELAVLLPGNDAVDLEFNWYGNLFSSVELINVFRLGPDNYDFQAGYSHEVWGGGPDLRLSATGYRFGAGSNVYGVRGGVELKSRDGVFSLNYYGGYDRVNSAYHTVGGFVNIGIELSNLLSGESPFVMPEPIFRSPRNLRRLLARPVHREYRSHNDASTLETIATGAGPCPNNCSAAIGGATIIASGIADLADTISAATGCYQVSGASGSIPLTVHTSRQGTTGQLSINIYSSNACAPGDKIRSFNMLPGADCVSGPVTTSNVVRSFLIRPQTTPADAGCVTVSVTE